MVAPPVVAAARGSRPSTSFWLSMVPPISVGWRSAAAAGTG